VNLGSGTWVDERQEANVRGFERATIVADELVLFGTEESEPLRGTGCGARVYGLGGGDSLTVGSDAASCRPARASGGPGDDHLFGGERRDLLYGGSGADYADGNGGRDLCRAEQEASCEE
jgi:Ca2+-binding RTX toxin-like protein